MANMETRKESLSALKICRFCLTQNEPLSSLYEKSKAPKNSVTLSTKILTCVAIEVFPSDKMPQYICTRCKLFMDLSYRFKQICRQSDQNILHFVQSGTSIEPLVWPSLLNKVFKAHTKFEFGGVKTVTQDGATFKLTAEEISDVEEGDDENVYSVKIGDGSEELKHIKVITSVNNKDSPKEGKKEVAAKGEAPKKLVQEGCWPCDECECTYPLEQLLTLHKSQKHRAKTVECPECDAKFFTKYDLLTHQLRHSTEYPFQCVACDKKFKRLCLLKRHEKVIHTDLPQLQCGKCPATFLSQIELEAHGMKHEPNLPRRYYCKMCDKRFLDSNSLDAHMEILHKKKPAFDCNYCPERFSNMTKLAKHIRSHAGERPYPCKHCDKSFMKSHHYTRHLRIKHCETIRTPSGNYTEAEAYRCEECEDAFATQDELIYHSALHATRSLTCPLCQEKFDDVDTVTAHIKSHVNGAEFMCDYCELIFTTQEKLDTHIEASHDSEVNDKDTTENEDEDMEEYEDEPINVKEEKNHMLVEIQKAGDYVLSDSVSMEEDENNEIDQLVASELELSMNDATGPLLAGKTWPQPNAEPLPPKPAPAVKVDALIANPGVSITRLDLAKLTANIPLTITNVLVKPAENVEESPNIPKKGEEIKKKVIQQPSSPVPVISEKKEKPVAKVESSAAAGASDLSLRLLEKELADLQRTNMRNDVAKTPAKPMDTLKKRSQIHTSTPKPRPIIEKKEVPVSKPIPEKPPQEKRPPGRPPKEKIASIKEDKEVKEKPNVSVKEDTKEVKEKETPKLVKNGASEDSPLSDEPIRRSTRPSKVKDYAKMIRDSPDEDDETSEEEPDEQEIKEAEKSKEPARRGRKPLPKPSPAAAGATTPVQQPILPKKRGRPRKDQTQVVPPKISKKDESDGEEESVSEVKNDSKLMEEDTTVADDNKTTTETKNESADPVSKVIVSPCGQTLKKVPIKALPPGVKPLPLPRKMTSGEVCEMQIGKKVVKVQKIVMTKAEVEAMTKKGLVEIKDGTIVLKQGIKLPGGGAASLISQMAAEEQKKESQSTAKPTRCDFGDD